MTSVKNQKGFTIIEIILFLAISGLVLIIGFAGIGNRTGLLRFTDSMRSLNAYMQTHYNEVINGVNTVSLDCSGLAKTNPAGTDIDCVFLGKYFLFDETADKDIVTVHTLAGKKLTPEDILAIQEGAGSNDADRLLLHAAEPTSVAVDQHNIEWGTEFLSANAGVTEFASPGFGILRSPDSSRLILIAHTGSIAPANSMALETLIGDPELFDITKNGYDRRPSWYGCFKGANNQYASINVGFRERQDAFETLFEGKDQFGKTLRFDPAPPATPNTCGPI